MFGLNLSPILIHYDFHAVLRRLTFVHISYRKEHSTGECICISKSTEKKKFEMNREKEKKKLKN